MWQGFRDSLNKMGIWNKQANKKQNMLVLHLGANVTENLSNYPGLVKSWIFE